MVTLADKYISCGGGMLYMGTGELQDRIPNFVSNIEHYQQTPQMVRDYVEGLFIVPAPKKYINFQRVDTLKGVGRNRRTDLLRYSRFTERIMFLGVL